MMIPQNKYYTSPLMDFIDPQIETRTAEEITEDVIRKTGITLK